MSHARLNDPWTSHAAIPDNITQQAYRVLTAYRNGDAMIDHEAYRRVGLGSQRLAHQRCSDLRYFGFIEPTGEVDLTPSGKSAQLCRIAPLGLAYLDAMERHEVKNVRPKTDLRSYQQRVISYLYESDEAMAVLKMGAGKTAAVLTAIEELISDGVIRHALVVAPKRVATITWPDEIEAWAHLMDLRYVVLDGTAPERLRKLHHTSQRDITIIGIDNVQWLVKLLEDAKADNPIWDCLVIDETSRLKDPTSKRARALASIAGRFRLRWGMTGTPAPNSLMDLFNPLKVITDGRLWGKSFYKWQRENFFPTDFKGYVWAVHPHKEAQILADAASISIALGEDEMPDLPAMTLLVEPVTLPDDARRAYRDMETKLFADLEDDEVLAMSQAVATGKLAQAANGFMYGANGVSTTNALHSEKERWFKELVDDLDGEPLIVVYEYKADLAMIRRLFGDVPYLGSGVSDAAASAHVAAWNRGELPIFALHPASGGHGLNLQHGGSRMAWISPPWSAELWDQTVARLYRPGQAGHVMVHVCVAEDTVDELKRLRVVEKLNAQAAFEQYLSRVAPGAYARAAVAQARPRAS